MAEQRPSGHKRSKSSLALSLLHRDKPKSEHKDEEALSATHSEAGSASGSPTATAAPTSHHSFGSLHRPHRHKSREPTDRSENGLEPNLSRTNTKTEDVKKPNVPDTNMTIEQSVKLFKLFEILRSGDKDAVAKAVGESSALEGTTVLHLAVQCAESQVVEQTIALTSSQSRSKVDINSQDREGNTPLHLASKLGQTSTVRLLLEQQNIDSSLLNFQGKSPLDLARNPDIFQQLQLSRSLFVDAQVKTVHKYVVQGDYDGLEKLLEESRVEALLDINGGELATDPSTIETGGTLLHEAARKRDLRLIQLLLLHGADPFRRDRKGKLPQDVTKDDRTRGILKKSPAAAAAQRGIQEKAILGKSHLDQSPGGKEGREMKGYLKKWTNYTSGYKLRWFVLEDGVLSYYKHQDDAGSACRGAINMRIAKLYMDPQDKSRFEILGKSSVKYHLKANHVVEAKRWFWALNNSIQWTKDEAREEEKRNYRDTDATRQVREDPPGYQQKHPSEKPYSAAVENARLGGKGLRPATAVTIPSPNASRVSFHDSEVPGSAVGDDQASLYGSYDASIAGNDMARIASNTKSVNLACDLDDDDEYGDDASSHELQPTSKDAFNITAQSASFQLSLLAQASKAMKKEVSTNPTTPISDPAIVQAVDAYESAIRSIQSMVGDLLKISRDRDAYWQYRLDRETDMRRLWEDSMTRVAKEQEELEGRIGESEEKRKRTKRALRDALEGASANQSRAGSPEWTEGHVQFSPGFQALPVIEGGIASPQRKSFAIRERGRRRSTIADLTNLSDSDSEADEEFFDAVDAGEVEVVDAMPVSPPPLPSPESSALVSEKSIREAKYAEIVPSFKGYEDPVRQRLKMDADDRPKISLWGILKSMIGKDMTKMTLPVSFNEPSSLLQRVAEDMEYTELLDTAADRSDSTERMVYVAAFAASVYASTIGRVAKPFNPLLGETYEYARPDKSFRFFIEQVSHHPPIGAAWAESPKWDYYGESAVRSKFYGKSFDINPLGTWFLKLRPASGGEELYTWKKVTSSVVGIITGSPTVDNYGPMEVKNWTTGETCNLDFKQRGWKASSAFHVSGKVVAADGKTRWSIGGRWNDKIYARLTPGFEGPVEPPAGLSTTHEPGSPLAFLVWEAHKRPTGIPFNLTPFVVTLNALPEKLRPLLPPTDTRLRPDQRAMEDGEYDFAAIEKNRVEEKQRAKRREREAEGVEFVPHWFTKGKCEITGEEYWVSNGEYWNVRDEVGKGGKWETEDIF